MVDAGSFGQEPGLFCSTTAPAFTCLGWGCQRHCSNTSASWDQRGSRLYLGAPTCSSPLHCTSRPSAPGTEQHHQNPSLAAHLGIYRWAGVAAARGPATRKRRTTHVQGAWAPNRASASQRGPSAPCGSLPDLDAAVKAAGEQEAVVLVPPQPAHVLALVRPDLLHHLGTGGAVHIHLPVRCGCRHIGRAANPSCLQGAGVGQGGRGRAGRGGMHSAQGWVLGALWPCVYAGKRINARSDTRPAMAQLSQEPGQDPSSAASPGSPAHGERVEVFRGQAVKVAHLLKLWAMRRAAGGGSGQGSSQHVNGSGLPD